MFRYKRGIKEGYDRQGYIYFTSRQYKAMSKEDREKIRQLCIQSGGEHYRELLEFVTTDATATAIGMKYCISKATLYRAVRKYYESFPDKL